MAIKEQFKTIKKNWLIALIVILLIIGAFFIGSDTLNVGSSTELYTRSGGADYALESSYAPRESFAAPAPLSLAFAKRDSATAEDERKVTTNANINTKVEQGEFFQAEQKLKSIVTTTNSLLLQENVRRWGEDKKAHHTGAYTIKVDSSKLDAVSTQLKEIGKVESFVQRKEDITESYKNLEIEIATEKQRLERYHKILQDAKTVEDKITLNDRIFDQERRIKYLEDSLKNADKQVSYSTIYIDIKETEPAYANLKWVDSSELVVGLVNSTASVIYLVVVLLPYAIVAILIWLLVRWLRNKNPAKKTR